MQYATTYFSPLGEPTGRAAGAGPYAPPGRGPHPLLHPRPLPPGGGGANGNPTGYAGGIDKKLRLLAHEGAAVDRLFAPARSTAP